MEARSGTDVQIVRLWKQGICCFSTVVPRHHASALIFRICQENQPTRLNRDNRRPANIAFSVPPSQ